MRVLRVVRAGGLTAGSLLGNLATPALLDACNDGRAHEAWCWNGAWRLRDDAFDADYKPADVPYTKVLAGWYDTSS